VAIAVYQLASVRPLSVGALLFEQFDFDLDFGMRVDLDLG